MTVGPVELLRILAAVGWPRMTFGAVVIEGPEAWRTVTPAPLEVRAILARLGRRELLAITAVARRRLRAWLDARKATPPPSPRPWRITSLKFYGDEELLPVLAGALDALPEPVADYVLADCIVIGTGRGTGGFTTGRFPPLRPIVLAGGLPDAEVRRLFHHEVGHVWTLEEPTPTPTSVEIVRARHINAVRGWAPSIAVEMSADEATADWLAAAWGAQ